MRPQLTCSSPCVLACMCVHVPWHTFFHVCPCSFGGKPPYPWSHLISPFGFANLMIKRWVGEGRMNRQIHIQSEWRQMIRSQLPSLYLGWRRTLTVPDTSLFRNILVALKTLWNCSVSGAEFLLTVVIIKWLLPAFRKHCWRELGTRQSHQDIKCSRP